MDEFVATVYCSLVGVGVGSGAGVGAGGGVGVGADLIAHDSSAPGWYQQVTWRSPLTAHLCLYLSGQFWFVQLHIQSPDCIGDRITIVLFYVLTIH